MNAKPEASQVPKVNKTQITKQPATKYISTPRYTCRYTTSQVAPPPPPCLLLAWGMRGLVAFRRVPCAVSPVLC